jgi:serine/threonine protein kinase
MSGLSGKYRLDARLGGGGMAEVFVASTVGAEGFARKVAIKRVLPGYSENPAFAKMFIDEARISSRLSHPNIVGVLDFDRDHDGRLYLVMELVYGKDLAALASSGGPLPVPVIIHVIAETLRGLGHAHDLPYVVDDMMIAGSHTIRSMRGLVHRDVSPHNVLLSWEGAVKVSDFGIAKARTASSATASELIKGKPAYMSPEQANGETLDGRSDLFAVGVMLWELLAGRRLFVGDDTRALLAAVLFAKIPRLRTIRPDLPKDLERVVAKLLERDLPLRYQTAEEALADLLACAQSPKDGTAQLQRTLAERFPREAPVRHSAVRERSGHNRSPAPPVRSAPEHPTVVAMATPPLPTDALRSAPTHALPATVAAERRRALLIGGGIVAAIVVIAIIASASGSSNSKQIGLASPTGPVPIEDAHTPPSKSPDAALPDAATAPPAASVDASVPAVPDAQAPLDAAEPAPPVDAKVGRDTTNTGRTTPEVPASRKTGRLEVTAFPALTVYIDGKRVHDTPVSRTLPVGRHTVRLVNRDIGRDETISVTIRENQTEAIQREQD